MQIDAMPNAVAQAMAWHESQGWLFTKDGKTLRLGDRKNVLDFEMGPPNVK